MSDLASEREIKEYRDNINDSSNSIIDILRGSSYPEIIEILKVTQEKVDRQLNCLILF